MVEWRHLKFVTSAARPEISKGHAIPGPIAFSPPSPSTLYAPALRRSSSVSGVETQVWQQAVCPTVKISAGVARRGKRPCPIVNLSAGVASGPCPRGNDCPNGKADAKGLQRKHRHDVRGPSVGLWQSLETVGKQLLLRFQPTMTASCN
jgi:hypothetical protein